MEAHMTITVVFSVLSLIVLVYLLFKSPKIEVDLKNLLPPDYSEMSTVMLLEDYRELQEGCIYPTYSNKTSTRFLLKPTNGSLVPHMVPKKICRVVGLNKEYFKRGAY